MHLHELVLRPAAFTGPKAGPNCFRFPGLGKQPLPAIMTVNLTSSDSPPEWMIFLTFSLKQAQTGLNFQPG
jgi:hypothetical protein